MQYMQYASHIARQYCRRNKSAQLPTLFQPLVAVPPLITAIQPVLALPCLAYAEHLMGGDMYQKSESLASNNRGPIYHVIDLEKGVLNQDS